MQKNISIPVWSDTWYLCLCNKNLFLKFETKKPAHFFLVKTVIPKLGHIYSIFFLETTKRPNQNTRLFFVGNSMLYR